MQRFLFLFLLFITVGCSSQGTSTPTATPTPSAFETKVLAMTEAIYSACETQMKWEEIPSDGLKVSTATYPNTFTYQVTSNSDGTVSMTHLYTHQVANFRPYSTPAYTVVPLLFKTESGTAWSGLMLIREDNGKFFIERSLTVMNEEQLKQTIKALEELNNFLQNQQSG